MVNAGLSLPHARLPGPISSANGSPAKSLQSFQTVGWFPKACGNRSNLHRFRIKFDLLKFGENSRRIVGIAASRHLRDACILLASTARHVSIAPHTGIGTMGFLLRCLLVTQAPSEPGRSPDQPRAAPRIVAAWGPAACDKARRRLLPAPKPLLVGPALTPHHEPGQRQRQQNRRQRTQGLKKIRVHGLTHAAADGFGDLLRTNKMNM